MKFGFHRKKKDIPEGLWMKCESCGEMLFRKELQDRLYVCPKCDYHYAVPSHERVRQLLDEGTFEEWYSDLGPTDPLGFTAGKSYKDKLRDVQVSSGLKDAALMGRGLVKGNPVALGVLDTRFLMASMGSVVGEKIARTVEEAGRLGLTMILVSASGGARMQESALALLQMAKTSAALARFGGKGGLFISVLTHPTTGGVTASFASLGDIIVAEPKALIGFTGPRVIQQTIRQELPEGFQTSEFMLAHGFVDKVVHRRDLRDTLALLLDYCCSR